MDENLKACRINAKIIYIYPTHPKSVFNYLEMFLFTFRLQKRLGRNVSGSNLRISCGLCDDLEFVQRRHGRQNRDSRTSDVQSWAVDSDVQQVQAVFRKCKETQRERHSIIEQTAESRPTTGSSQNQADLMGASAPETRWNHTASIGSSTLYYKAQAVGVSVLWRVWCGQSSHEQMR